MDAKDIKDIKDVFGNFMLLLAISCGISVIVLLLITKKYRNLTYNKSALKKGAIYYRFRNFNNKKYIELLQIIDGNKTNLIKILKIKNDKLENELLSNTILYVRRNSVVNKSGTIFILTWVSIMSFIAFVGTKTLN